VLVRVLDVSYAHRTTMRRRRTAAVLLGCITSCATDFTHSFQPLQAPYLPPIHHGTSCSTLHNKRSLLSAIDGTRITRLSSHREHMTGTTRASRSALLAVPKHLSITPDPQSSSDNNEKDAYNDDNDSITSDTTPATSTTTTTSIPSTSMPVFASTSSFESQSSLDDSQHSTESAESSVNGGNNSDDATILTNKSQHAASTHPSTTTTKRRLELMWCSSQYCSETAREKVVSKDNHIVLNSPATGQVAYYWDNNHHTIYSSTSQRMLPDTANKSPCLPESVSHDDTSVNGEIKPAALVLLLVKPGDEDLIKQAAQAVQQLTCTSTTNHESNHVEAVPIHILLDPTTAARIKHYHGVESDRIHLFEAQRVPGYGSDLRPGEEPIENIDGGFGGQTSLPDVPLKRHRAPYTMPDLICTLGGDGLLMYAAGIFQGPSPPILSVSGGSLGFLTPFKADEMVEAIRVALGLTDDSQVVSQVDDLDVYPPNMKAYPYEPLRKSFVFGANDRICLSIRMRLECRILNRQGAIRARYNVLNEVVIDRGGSPYLAALECFCDDVHLTTVQADGVIFATPTGSTAYR
jgi:NAD kinase